jgi:hypothetical protein
MMDLVDQNSECIDQATQRRYSVGQAMGQTLEQWPRSGVAITAREVAVAAAGVGPPSRDYLDLIAPGDSRQVRHALCDEAGCGLVVRALLRLLGVAHPSLGAPYCPGAAFSDVWTVAADCDALKLGPVRAQLVYDEPAIVAYGRGLATHMSWVCHWHDDYLDSVDGGQPDVRCLRRPIQREHGRVTQVDHRDVRWWCRLSDLRDLMTLTWRLPGYPRRCSRLDCWKQKGLDT